uniref:Uncharacterized protein n=1 Tax=Panagrolaimus sp. JU765 TaxID=591449 RepID=A0AC34QDX9_9BILA
MLNQNGKNSEVRRHSDAAILQQIQTKTSIEQSEPHPGRFQVTKSGEDNTNISLMEPTTSIISSGNSEAENLDITGEGLRKFSSAGRFKVFTNAAPIQKDRAETAPPDTHVDTGEVDFVNDEKEMHVHFSLGEKHDRNYEAIDSGNADSTLMNAKNTHVDTGEVDFVNDEKEMHVHFSLGEKHDRNYETIDSGNADSTLMNVKSWRHCATLEHPPVIDFYRETMNPDGIANTRPSMMQLLGASDSVPQDKLNEYKEQNLGMIESQIENMSPEKGSKNFESFQPPPSTPRSKFGWIEGVFFRCILNIFGVMLYLRVSWVAGQAGIGLGTVVVLLASLVTTITALSTCAICTNGDVKGGGAYFLISRSLGPEFGGSIGLIFSVANAVGAAMYVVGFAETVRDLMVEYGFTIFDGGLNDVRLIGLVTCIILMGIVFIGTGFESKMQMGLLVILTLSILDYFLGTFFPVSHMQRLKGITGYSSTTLSENFLPNFRDGYNFFTVFSIYFPAATGIMAGANISGDLADPQKAIPLGTLLAIFVTTLVYVATIWVTGSTCVRDADGINYPMIDPNSTSIFGSYIAPECVANETCKYGLMNFFQVMEAESVWGPLITAGIFAATLSSALASLVSAPKIFQAVCRDRLFPYINVFAKGSGKDEEPRRAYLLGFVISMIMILIGDLNAIAPIISNFFLCSYALINYACFDNSFAESPGFRPSFKYYNMWVSLMGALLCVTVMFIVSWFTALLTFIFFGLLFIYIAHRKPDVNWGSSTQAHSYRNALQSIIKLENTDEHVKNYRPQLLVLTGNPAARPSLVDFAHNITRGNSLMVCGNVVTVPLDDYILVLTRRLNAHLRDWLKKRHIKSFYTSAVNPNLREGTQSLFQTAGLGRLRPNIVLIGFKHGWALQGLDGLASVNEYFGIIQDAFGSNMSVMMLRNSGGGLDFSDLMKQQNLGDVTKLPEVHSSTIKRNDNSQVSNSSNEKPAPSEETDPQPDTTSGVTDDEYEDSPLNILNDYLDDEDDGYIESDGEASGAKHKDLSAEIDFTDSDKTNSFSTPRQTVKFKEDVEANVGLLERTPGHERMSLIRRRSTRRLTTAQRELLSSINRFQRKVKKGTIDVWWLYDDGGLTLLIPYLLTQQKSYLEDAQLRVFTISTSASGMDQEARNMAALLSKFRISFSDVKVIPDVNKRPKLETKQEFEKLIKPFYCQTVDENFKEGMITEAELSSQRNKTNRQLRIAELLKQHSSDADLIVLTLPVPRKGLVSSCLYLAWIDMMTRDLPPTLLVRGNQQSVLTFYS